MVLYPGLAFLALLIGIAVYSFFKKTKNIGEADEVFNKLWFLRSLAGESVMIFEPEASVWLGRAPYVKERMEFLVDASRNLGLIKESMLPVKIGIARMHYSGALTHFSCIVFDKSTMGYENKELDECLAHEFSHVITWEEKEEHGVIWRKTYQILLEQLREL